jgi:hypothetical protein
MKFKKKPVIIEAEQWFPGIEIEGLRFTKGEYGVDYGCGIPSVMVTIGTLEGSMRVSPGDWIITGVKGEKYPCKPDIFELTYDRVEND